MKISSLFLVVAAGAALILGGCATSPEPSEGGTEAAYTAADEDTVRKEIEVGQAALAKLAGKYGIVQDEEATEYLNKYLKSLGLYVERQEIEYFAGILATNQVNAYALPGGYILVSLGALKRVEHPGALAGILAHELGHINKKHILDQVKIEVNYSFFETLARMLAGSRQVITTSINQINEKIEERLFVEGYASDDEFEADAHAVDLLQALNLSAVPYLEYLIALGEKEGKNEDMQTLDATHPPVADRLAGIERKLDRSLPAPRVTEAFARFKSIIDAIEIEEENTEG